MTGANHHQKGWRPRGCAVPYPQTHETVRFMGHPNLNCKGAGTARTCGAPQSLCAALKRTHRPRTGNQTLKPSCHAHLGPVPANVNHHAFNDLAAVEELDLIAHLKRVLGKRWGHAGTQRENQVAQFRCPL